MMERDLKHTNLSPTSSGPIPGANLHLDLNGRVWVNNDQYRVDILDPVSEVVTPLEMLEPRLKGKMIKVRGNDAKGVIWGTADENILFTYDGQFHLVEPQPGNGWELKNNYIFPSPWGTLLSVRDKALAELDNEGCLLNSYPMTEAGFGSITSTDSSVLLVELQWLPGNVAFNAVIFGVKKNAPPKPVTLSYHGKPFSFNEIKNTNAYIGVSRDAQGRLWVSFMRRLLVFDAKGELIAEVPTSNDYWQYFEATKIFFDKQGQAGRKLKRAFMWSR